MIDFSNTKLQWSRSVTSYSKVCAVVGYVIRNRRRFMRVKPPGTYLDLGCGDNVDATFINLDYNWHPGIDVCWDVTQGLPFRDKYVGGIFTEHMIEHLSFAQARAVLCECRRVLRPGGILRVVVPDGELYLTEYAKHIRGEAHSMPYAENDSVALEVATPMASVNRIFRDHGHQFIWDFETLSQVLIACGFAKAERRPFGESSDPKLLRDTPRRRVESLYVDAC